MAQAQKTPEKAGKANYELTKEELAAGLVNPIASSPAIRNAAYEIVRGCTTDLQKAKAIFEACEIREPSDPLGKNLVSLGKKTLRITYGTRDYDSDISEKHYFRQWNTKTAREVFTDVRKVKYNTKTGAPVGRNSFYTRTADCDEAAYLFTAMARDVGLKAVVAFSAGNNIHGIALVLINGKSYYADVAWGIFFEKNDFIKHRDKLDVDHSRFTPMNDYELIIEFNKILVYEMTCRGKNKYGLAVKRTEAIADYAMRVAPNDYKLLSKFSEQFLYFANLFKAVGNHPQELYCQKIADDYLREFEIKTIGNGFKIRKE